jgi:hypothetical protein
MPRPAPRLFQIEPEKSTVEPDHHAGGVHRPRRGEERDPRGDLLRLAEAAGRNVVLDLAGALLGRAKAIEGSA